MPHFSQRSKDNLKDVDPRLKEILNEAIKHVDFTVVWGHRGEAEQNAAFDRGASRLRWPRSRHNTLPSQAVDIVPYPGLYNAGEERFYEMATYVFAEAARLGVPLRWGGHWNNFKDWAHFEIER